MSATASSRAEVTLFTCWCVFAAVNTLMMYVLPGEETIPFHFVWISLALVFGLSPWSTLRTVVVLALVCASTGLALVLHANNEVIGWEETTEVPLMTSVFLATMWHVRRRDRAVLGERRHLQNEVRMREAQRRFVRFASHELRTPMTVARGYAELIRSESESEQLEDDAAVVIEEIGKVERIATRLVELAQVVDDGVTTDPHPTDVDRLTRQTVKRWRRAAPRHWMVDASAGVVWVDPDRLVTALDSLLDNARRYTQPDGYIGVTARRTDTTAEITVWDDGTGLRPDVLHKVFDQYLAGDSGTIGMGLAIVRSVAEAHGGTARAANRPQGGAEFTLSLPLVPVVDELVDRAGATPTSSR
jgi:two-component system, OmpR family, sensor kinase